MSISQIPDPLLPSYEIRITFKPLYEEEKGSPTKKETNLGIERFDLVELKPSTWGAILVLVGTRRGRRRRLALMGRWCSRRAPFDIWGQ
jgi:hypothetical protein